MTGQAHGMANEMIKIVNEKCALNKRIGVDIHCLWCIHHRLNLVAQDFKEVENINFVIKFIKWITAGDQFVSYTSFARSMSTGNKKKIPPPSETRWLFFRDALQALLDQTECVDQFLNTNDNHEKLVTHISTSKYPLGEIKDVHFTFRNSLIFAHFKFASWIFDILGEVNEIFPAKLSFVVYQWEYLVTFHSFLVCELQKLQNEDFGGFDFLAEIEPEKRKHFIVILKHLILNLKVRFHSASFSLNKKSIGLFLDYENMMIPNVARVGDTSRCGVSPILELFNIKDTPVTQQLSITLPHLDVAAEWRAIVPLFTNMAISFGCKLNKDVVC